MKRTTLATTGALAALAIALTGCVETGRSSSPAGGEVSDCPWEADDSITTTATIAWQPSPTGDLVVKDKGVLEACMPEATVSWKQFASGGDVVQAFGSSDGPDIGLVGSSPATRAVSAPLDLPVKVVWIYEVIGDAEALVSKDPSVTDVAGLKGKTVATPFGSTAHYSLLSALDEAGLVPDQDVKLVNLAPDAIPAAWQGSEVDAAWIWNPVLGELESDGGTEIGSSADTAQAGKPTYDVAMATNAFTGENAAFMEQWAKAQDWAVQQIEDDPADASASMAIQMGIEPDDAEELLDGYQYLRAADQASPQWLGGKMGEDLASTAGFLLAQGSIDAVADPQVYADAVDPAPAASVGG